MAQENALLSALLGGQGEQFAGYDPRQAGPAPNPNAPQPIPYGQTAPPIFTPNQQEAPWRPGGGTSQSPWDRIKQMFGQFNQPGYGGQPGQPSSPPSNPWGR